MNMKYIDMICFQIDFFFFFLAKNIAMNLE